MATHLKSLDELPGLVGTELGVTEWTNVSQDQVNKFADATGDHQWIHTDPVRAAAGPFGGTIAHGYLTLALTPKVISEVLEIDERPGRSKLWAEQGPVPGASAGRIQCPCRGRHCLRGAETVGNRGRVQCALRVRCGE